MAPLLADFRALRARMQQQGLFCSNKAYYAFKLATNLSILAGAMLTLALGANSWWLLLTSAFLLGLFWQQTGQQQTPAASFWLLLSSSLLTAVCQRQDLCRLLTAACWHPTAEAARGSQLQTVPEAGTDKDA